MTKPEEEVEIATLSVSDSTTTDANTNSVTSNGHLSKNITADDGGIVNKAFDGGLDIVKGTSTKDLTTINLESVTPALRLTWNNLTYTVSKSSWSIKNGVIPTREKTIKQILKPMAGELLGGQLTALMGPSGAGKSTLLNCITGRYETGVGGKITVVYNPVKGKQLTVAFVPQHEALFQQFTVRETLVFASRLKNRAPGVSHNDLADDVIKQLNMQICADTKISSCSGGQQKRVSIGVELISNPDILVLDEPTSGLDSSNADLCVQLLRDLAKGRGKSAGNPPAIVTTIHQPNNEIFNYFDNIYLLAKSGQAIFFGNPTTISDYLAGYGFRCPDYCNPADYAIEVANAKYGSNLFDSMAEQTRSTALALQDAATAQESGLEKKSTIVTVIKKMKARPQPFFYHSWLLMVRAFQTTCVKSPALLFKLLVNGCIALMLSFLWVDAIGGEDGCWTKNEANPMNLTESALLKQSFLELQSPAQAKQEYLDKVNTINNNAMFLFSTMFFVTVVYLISTVLSFPLEILTVKKEMSNSWYKVGSYFVGKTIADIPALTLSLFVLLAVGYPLSGQIPSLLRFGAFYTFLVLLGAVCETIGMFFGVLFASDMVIATLVTMASFFPVLLFGGFLVRVSAVPWYFRPLTYLSYVRYAFESILVIIYGFNRCSGGSTVAAFIDELVNAANPMEVMTTLWASLDISFRDATLFAPVLGVPVEHLESVINGTADYFGFNYLNEGNDAVNGSSNNYDQPSYVLYFYEVDDSFVPFNFAILVGILIFLRIMTFGVLVLKTRTSK